MHAPNAEQRPSGVAGTGDLPWGSHFGLFYASLLERLAVLVPFIKAGLEGNELCSWEVCSPLTVESATQALREAVRGFDRYLERGQLEVTAATEPSTAALSIERIERKLDAAILAGFDGLRLVCHADVSAKDGALAAFSSGIEGLNVLAAVLYSRAQLGTPDLMELLQEHRFALVCNSGRWEVLAGAEARHARHAQARAEAKLQSVFRNMSEGFAYHRIVLDAQGKACDYVFLEMNEAFERQTGLLAKDVLGKRVTQVLPGIEKDPADWIARYGRVALTGEPVQFESFAAQLGKWYAVSAFCPHKGYFAVTFSDVTGRKKAEAERQALEERLQVTLRSIGDAVISTDTLGRVVMLNRVAERLTGFTQAEASGRPLSEIFPIINELTGEQAENPVRKVIESGATIGLANHTALVRRDGTRISIADSAAPVRSDASGLLGVVLVFRDVTEQRQAERALGESEEKYRNLFANMTEEVHYWQLVRGASGEIETWRLIDANPPTLKTWGRSSIDEVRGKTTDEIFGPGAREHYLPVVKKIFAEGLPHSYEDYFPNLDRHFRFTSVPLGDRFITTGSDITAIKTAMRELVQADQQKNEFISVLSHELRNPLAPIRNSLYVLDRAGGLNERGRHSATVIGRQVMHLTRLIDDLLDVTRISKGKIRLQESRIDLRDVVSRVAEDLASVLEGHQVSVKLPPDPTRVYGDPTRLAQVIGNLLGNAAKFTPRGGRIDVRLSLGDGKALVEVEDSGAGIDPQMLARLFTPFVQADHTLDRSRGGLGLGLALAKGLVELHAGEISAHSEGLGRGARFSVRLPLEKRVETVVPCQAPAPRGNTVRRRILIIEDSLDAADSLRDVLELDGHMVATAANGTDGLARVRAFKPEIVLCDIGLPGMDGYAVAQALRQEPNGLEYYLIALSGYAQPEDVQRAHGAGFNAHLPKPPDFGELARLLAEAAVGPARA